jgi:hypothetical protein
VNQRVVAFAGFHDNVATATTVAAGGSAARDKLLTTEGQAAVAAVTGLYSDCGFVDKHGGKPLLVVGKPS